MVKNYILLFSAFLLTPFFADAATFTSNVASGSWAAPGSWSVVGSDADGIPDADDDVTIANSNTITLAATSHCRDITINGSLSYNTRALHIRGNFNRTATGTTVGVGTLYLYSVSGTVTCATTYTNGGNWNFVAGSTYTIQAGTIFNKINYFYIASGAQLVNNGSINLPAGSINIAGWGTYTNGPNSFLLVGQPLSGSFFSMTATGNTVAYTSANTPNIFHTNYFHLQLLSSGATTKTWTGPNLNVDGNLTIGTNVTLNCNNQNIRIRGNWINLASTNCQNMATIEFRGTTPQTITRSIGTESFSTLNVNNPTSVTLACPLLLLGNLDLNLGTFDVGTGNHNLILRGNFNDQSTFMGRQGTVTFNGTTPQTIGGAATTTFYSLTASNTSGIQVITAKQISNILNVTTGAFGPSGSGSITMLATGPATCARIASVGGSLTGTAWIIQTYINGPATAYWQYLSSPVNSTTLNDWDSDNRFYMSGVGGNEGNACCPIFRSVRTYSEATNTYTNITSTATVLNPARGYMVWMSDNQTALTGPLIFDTRGTPSFGTVSRAVTAGGAGGGYNLMGNPYACPINYSSVVAASTASLNANFLILQENGSYATSPNGGTIAGAQGFMALATTGGNIVFNESSKSTTATPNVIRQMAGNEIHIKAGNQVNGLGEETVVKLLPGADERMDYATDLPYLASPYDNATHIWSQNNYGEQFILNVIGTEADHLLIPLAVTSSTPGIQTLAFKELNSVTEYNCAWLEDVTTGARINLNATDTYEYDEAVMGATRNFILHLERNSDCTFDLQTTTASLDAQTNVFVSGDQILAQFTFETEQVVTISMYDLSGRMVMGETTMNAGTQTIALQNPDAHGIYLVRIQSGNEVSTKKIYY